MSLMMKYFVLKPKAGKKDDAHAAASRLAMCAYGNAIRKTDPELAQQLIDWAGSEEVIAAQEFGE